MLNPQELALLRGWMNHLGWPLLGQLYLDGADIAATRAQVLALRQRLALRSRCCKLPAWEAFWLAERKGGEAWLKQAESGLNILQNTPTPVPALDDPVAQWLAEKPARKLQTAGLATLQAVIAFRAEKGRLWWKGLPGFGSHSARLTEAFFKTHARELGLAGTALTVDPARPSATPGNPAIEDLFEARPGLSGEHGANRAPHGRCRIAANNDFEAVQVWLSLRTAYGHTWRGYRKEAERFLLWAVSERGKPLSSLDTADCKAYRDFLFAPPDHWLNPAFKPRWSRHWRPFKGPLTQRSVKLAETILSSMCEWLAKQRYLDANPFDGLPPLPAQEREALRVEHALDTAQWEWLLDHCAQCEADPPAGRDRRHYRRLWIALQLAYCTGLRLAELAAASFGDIRHKPRHGGQYWLEVLGKGSKRREVPIPKELAEELRCYARERGVAWGVPGSTAPIIGKFRKTAVSASYADATVETPFSAAGLHTVLRGFFREAADALKRSAPDGNPAALALERMTTHWLRHTHATHALERGAGLLLVKENLGHASLSTTSVYLHGDKDQRHQAMEKLFRKRADGTAN